MTSFSLPRLALSLALVGALGGLSPTLPATEVAPSPVLPTFLVYAQTIHLDAQGNADDTRRIEVAVDSAEVQAALQTQRIAFYPQWHRIEVVQAERRDAHGHASTAQWHVEADPDLAPGVPSGQAHLVIAFPSLQLGDTVALTVHTTRQALTPGRYDNFWWLPAGHYTQARLTLTADAALGLRAQSAGFETVPLPAAEGQVAWQGLLSGTLTGQKAGLNVSTYASYAALGEAARATVRVPLPSPAVRAATASALAGIPADADALTQVRALQRYVHAHVHYAPEGLVAHGRYAQSPDETLHSGVGDCKALVVLMGAMLRERGIRWTPTLLNTQASEGQPLPMASAYNHVVGYLPDSQTWWDPSDAEGRMPAWSAQRWSLQLGPAVEHVRVPTSPAPEMSMSEISMSRTLSAPSG